LQEEDVFWKLLGGDRDAIEQGRTADPKP